MGQQEIYDFLRENRNKWLSSREIANELEVSYGSVATCLQRLRAANIVHFKADKRAFDRMGRRMVYVYRFRK